MRRPWLKRILLCLALFLLGAGMAAHGRGDAVPFGALGGLLLGVVIPDRMLRE